MGGVSSSNCFFLLYVAFPYANWIRRATFQASTHTGVSTRKGIWEICDVIRNLSGIIRTYLRSGSSFTTIWGKEDVHSCRAAALPSKTLCLTHSFLLKDLFFPYSLTWLNEYLPKQRVVPERDSLMHRNFSLVILFIVSYDSEPGATTWIERMYLQAVLCRFQNARCM